jgi:hypothetical protein
MTLSLLASMETSMVWPTVLLLAVVKVAMLVSEVLFVVAAHSEDD